MAEMEKGFLPYCLKCVSDVEVHGSGQKSKLAMSGTLGVGMAEAAEIK